MPEENYLITAVMLMAVITYLTRATPFLLKMEKAPKLFNDVIEYLPVAIIASITVPALLVTKDGTLQGMNADLLAAIPVVIVALWSKSLIYSVCAGIGCHVAITFFT